MVRALASLDWEQSLFCLRFRWEERKKTERARYSGEKSRERQIRVPSGARTTSPKKRDCSQVLAVHRLCGIFAAFELAFYRDSLGKFPGIELEFDRD